MSTNMIRKIQTTSKLVAFTFDDGPNPLYTTRLLDIFADVGGKATFFMLGEQMKKYSELVKRVVKEGHEIGNHTYSHADLTQLSREQAWAELQENETLINELTGSNPVVFRPPFLAYNQDVSELAQQFGYRTISALNLEAKDWDQPGVTHILDETLKVVENGCILIFHDGFGDRSQTIAAVEKLVKELVKEGFQLITVSDLLKHQTMVK